MRTVTRTPSDADILAIFSTWQASREARFGYCGTKTIDILAFLRPTSSGGTIGAALSHIRKHRGWATPRTCARPIGPPSSAFLGDDRPHPVTGGVEPAGSCHQYRLQLLPDLAEYAGRLWIDWGKGYRAWIQRGDRVPKPIVELRRSFREDPFPGFAALILNLSDIETMPAHWVEALRATRGIYLLTCPRTREQYVGMASSGEGFFGRWREYFASGHGGNVGLKSRDPSDYQVSILETVGTTATTADLLELECLWKDKLQSRQMGLNRN